MNLQNSPWAPYVPTADDPWDLRKVAHLHRRAGFGAMRSELQRHLRDGVDASVQRLLHPAEVPAEVRSLLDSLKQGVLAGIDIARLKAWWLYRIVFLHRPLEEKMTLFWHSHFATSNIKVRSIRMMLAQNELFRRHALGEFASLLTAIISDPAVLVWLDGGDSPRERPNENFAREFLELFTLGIGNYNESDIRAAARAFTGWRRQGNSRLLDNDDLRFHFDRAHFDNGEKTFLRQTGPWGAEDIVRITLRQPACAEFLCRKLYRYFINEAVNPSAQLIRPLAAELREHRYSIRHVLGIILRSRHFYDHVNDRQRIQSPVEFSVGLLRMLDVPRSHVQMLALAAACDRQGQELFHPPNVRGWQGGRTWLNSTTMLERTNWCNDVIWGNPDLAMPPYDPQGWAKRENIPLNQAAAGFLELLLQGRLNQRSRAMILEAVRDGQRESLRRALQRIVHVPQFQLG